MNAVEPIYPPIEIEYLKLLKELQPIVVKAINSLGGKKPANAGSNYLGRIANTVNRTSDGYLVLRELARVDASKLLIRPALEAVFCGIAAVSNKEFLFRKIYSEWEEHNKLFAKDAAGKVEADKYLKNLQEKFSKNNPDYPTNYKPASMWDAAHMAGLLPVYEYAYRMYCKFTHSAMSAVSGNCRCNFRSVICLSSIRLHPSGVRRSEGERSEPSAAEPRRGEATPRAKNWSRAGHVGFLLGCSQTHPTPNLT